MHVLDGKLRGEIARLELALLEARQARVGDVLGQGLKVEIVVDAGPASKGQALGQGLHLRRDVEVHGQLQRRGLTYVR